MSTVTFADPDTFLDEELPRTTMYAAPAPVLHSLRDRAALSPADAAIFLGVGFSTLKKWRGEGVGPRYARFGRSIVYRPDDLDAFVQASMVK